MSSKLWFLNNIGLEQIYLLFVCSGIETRLMTGRMVVGAAASGVGQVSSLKWRNPKTINNPKILMDTQMIFLEMSQEFYKHFI